MAVFVCPITDWFLFGLGSPYHSSRDNGFENALTRASAVVRHRVL
jgi:hypothetical protein